MICREKEYRQILSFGIVTRADYAIPWIQKLKSAGYQVLVLSNFSDKVKRDNEDAMDFLEYVDGGILSYRDGVIKPDPAIYRRCLAGIAEKRKRPCSWMIYSPIWIRQPGWAYIPSFSGA